MTFAAMQAVDKQPSLDLKANLLSGESISKHLARDYGMKIFHDYYVITFFASEGLKKL